MWGPSQEKAFREIKQELSKPTVLALYNPQVDTKVSADVSSYGLGAVCYNKTSTGNLLCMLQNHSKMQKSNTHKLRKQFLL